MAEPSLKICVGCGDSFPQEDVVMLEHRWVCASCKPEILQRVAEGVGLGAPSETVWRDKKDVVLPIGADMPDFCIRCNKPAGGVTLKRNLSWHTRWLYLLILAGLLIYVIVALIVRKRAVVHLGFCEQHYKQRQYKIMGSLGTAVLGIALIVLINSDWALLLGVLMFFGGLIAGVLFSRTVSATFIDKDYVHFRGAGESFLATLPRFTSNSR